MVMRIQNTLNDKLKVSGYLFQQLQFSESMNLFVVHISWKILNRAERLCCKEERKKNIEQEEGG